jgi:hypothetical protein
MSVQWAHLGDGRVLVAAADGAWTHRPQLGALGPNGPMPEWLEATPETMAQLLDGAIALAELEAPPVDPPPLTARRWAWHLIGQWYCARHSIALMPAVIDRYEALGRPDLAEFARAKLEEERGHDEFALDDLRALGYDAEAAVRVIAPAPTVIATVDYARGCAHGAHPVEFIGYVYALERRILRVSDEWFAALGAVLPPGVEAASFFKTHARDLDRDHVPELVDFIARLPAGDRALVAAGCHRATRVCCGWTAADCPSDAELDARFARLVRAPAGRFGPSGSQAKGAAP